MHGKAGIGKIVLIAALAGVILLAGIAVVGTKAMGGKKKHAPKPKPATSEMALGEFVVNLADTGEIRYLKTNVVIEVEGAAAKGGGHGGEAGADPKVRDAVIQVLSSKHFAELVQPDGKEKLKEDILAAVNERLKEGGEEAKDGGGPKAVDVFFSDFAMQ